MMMTSSMDGQRHLCGGERCEVAANFCGHLPERLGARILHFGNGFSVRVERLVFVPIVERKPVDIVDERLGRHAFGQDQRMIIEFDVVIGVPRRHVGWSRARLTRR